MAKKPHTPARAGLTEAKLIRFVAIRNKSAFTSNLQFELDADHAGFDMDALGEVRPIWGEDGQKVGYRWDTPFGQLQERPAERPAYRIVKTGEPGPKALAALFTAKRKGPSAGP